jgi:hypothetical protein
MPHLLLFVQGTPPGELFDVTRAYTSVLVDCAGESDAAYLCGCHFFVCLRDGAIHCGSLNRLLRSDVEFAQVVRLGRLSAPLVDDSWTWFTELDNLSDALWESTYKEAEWSITKNCQSFSRDFVQQLGLAWPTSVQSCTRVPYVLPLEDLTGYDPAILSFPSLSGTLVSQR